MIPYMILWWFYIILSWSFHDLTMPVWWSYELFWHGTLKVLWMEPSMLGNAARILAGHWWRRCLGRQVHELVPRVGQLLGVSQVIADWARDGPVVGQVSRSGGFCARSGAICWRRANAGVLDGQWERGQDSWIIQIENHLLRTPRWCIYKIIHTLNWQIIYTLLYISDHIRSYQIISALVNKTHVFRLEKQNAYGNLLSQDSRDGRDQVPGVPCRALESPSGQDQPGDQHPDRHQDAHHVLSGSSVWWSDQNFGFPRLGWEPPLELEKESFPLFDCSGWFWYCQYVSCSSSTNFVQNFLILWNQMKTCNPQIQVPHKYSYHLRLEGCATLARDPDLQVVVTSLNSVWVVNRGTSAKELAAGELFGFNTGSFLEIPSGLVFWNKMLLYISTDSQVIWCLPQKL